MIHKIHCNNCKRNSTVPDESEFPLICTCGKTSEDGVLWVIA